MFTHVNSDVEGYLKHPINQYHLIKRLSYQWLNLLEVLAEPTYKGNYLLCGRLAVPL